MTWLPYFIETTYLGYLAKFGQSPNIIHSWTCRIPKHFHAEGVDSSYTYELTWVWEGVLFEALPYIVYIRERHCFSLVRTSKNAIKFKMVKVDVQKGGVEGLNICFYNRCVGFIHIMFFSHCFHMVIVLMTAMFLLVRFCIWVLGFYN